MPMSHMKSKFVGCDKKIVASVSTRVRAGTDVFVMLCVMIYILLPNRKNTRDGQSWIKVDIKWLICSQNGKKMQHYGVTSVQGFSLLDQQYFDADLDQMSHELLTGILRLV